MTRFSGDFERLLWIKLEQILQLVLDLKQILGHLPKEYTHSQTRTFGILAPFKSILLITGMMCIFLSKASQKFAIV